MNAASRFRGARHFPDTLESRSPGQSVRLGRNRHLAHYQRTIAEIFERIRMLGALVGGADLADRLAGELEAGLAARWLRRIPQFLRVVCFDPNEPNEGRLSRT
jgi:hypothetical protein